MTTNIQWKTHTVQTEFCQSEARYRTLVAGRRFGKNHAAITSEADFALHPEKYDHGDDDPEQVILWWVGPTYNQTKKYGYEKAKDAVPDQLIRDHKDSAPFEIELFNGVTWEFYSFDRPKSLDGAGVDSMVIDERGYMDTSIWEDNLAAMLLDTNGRVSFIGKPWQNEHFRETFEKGQNDDHPNYDSWHATSYDNPLIPDERIDEIFGDLPEPVFRREILAEFGAGGNLLTLDMLSYEPPSVLEHDAGMKWHVAVDLGIETNPSKARANDTDYWSLSIVAEHPLDDVAYLVDHFRRRGQSPAQAAEWIAESIRDVPTNTVKYEAVQAQSWFERDLKEAGLHPIPHTPESSKEDRILHMSVLFNSEKVQLIDWSEIDYHGVDWEPFKSEWRAFPDGDHDDSLDSTAMALESVDFGGRYQGLSGDMYGRNNE